MAGRPPLKLLNTADTLRIRHQRVEELNMKATDEEAAVVTMASLRLVVWCSRGVLPRCCWCCCLVAHEPSLRRETLTKLLATLPVVTILAVADDLVVMEADDLPGVKVMDMLGTGVADVVDSSSKDQRFVLR
jgi:hypothetical protein